MSYLNDPGVLFAAERIVLAWKMCKIFQLEQPNACCLVLPLCQRAMLVLIAQQTSPSAVLAESKCHSRHLFFISYGINFTEFSLYRYVLEFHHDEIDSQLLVGGDL